MARSVALCTRTDGAWDVTVADRPDARVQVKRLDQVEAAVRRALRLADLEVEVRPELDAEAEQVLADARTSRDEAQRATDRAACANRQAVALLLGRGLPMRDVGVLMRVSAQRVQQLSRSRPEEERA